MTIRNPVLFGLNVSSNFTDVLSRNACLENLGLNVDDLDVIRGISGTELTKIDLQNVSGLDVNLTRYISRLKSDTSLYSGIVDGLGGYQNVLQGNFESYGAISGGAIKFKYISNNSGSGLTEDNIKFGDISTSRVSSWSSASTDVTDTEQPISYGGSVQVKGVVKIGQKPNYQPGNLNSIINVLDTPEPIRFATEIPTDVLEIEINGQTRYVYAMRGIPIVFLTAFKRIRAELEVIPISEGNPTFTITDTDESATEIQSTPTLINGKTSILVYNSSSFKERELKIYFPPNNIELLNLPSLSILELPPVKLLKLKNINISLNKFQTIPDFNKLNYIFDGLNAPLATLNTINLGRNPLYLSPIDEYSRWGTYAASRLPKTLTNLNIYGTYIAEQDWQNVENFVVIRASLSEFNLIECDSQAKQTYSFGFLLQDDTTQVTEIEGIFFDKLEFTADQTTYFYVYVENPTTTSNEPVEGSDWMGFIENRYKGSSKKLDVLDLSTRCPNLKIYNHYETDSRRLFKTPLSKYPNVEDDKLFEYADDDEEYTPRVELRSIETYNVNDNRFTKLNPIFKNPSTYLSIGEKSTLRNFNVNGNGRSLTEQDGSVNFNIMDDIRTINISLTNLPIPIGLSGKQQLRTFSAFRSNFPPRPTVTIPSQYNQQLSSGGYVDSVTGDGNPSNANNYLFTSKYPTNEGEYIFNNCEKLNSISFPSSYMDGMLPKFIGNNVLRTIDLRSTNIEGGRPPMTTNNGLSGRRFVAWDDTFADCTNLTTLRMSGRYIGRNIGIYDPVTQQYSSAAFQGSTFNLPFLQRLEIISTGRYLKGQFFSITGLTSLRFLFSYNSGWGEDIVGGTPLPSFQGKNLLEEIRLQQNNFSGEITLKNLPQLKKVILRQNLLSSFGDYEGLNNLIILSVSNNNTLTGNLPNFSTGSPNIRTISANGCSLNSYIQGSIVDLNKLRSLDISGNNFNTNSVDTILLDCLANYTNAPRKGVVINLSGGNMGSPSKIEVQTPTQSTTTDDYTITVQQPPLQTNPEFQDFYTQIYEYDDTRPEANVGDKLYSIETNLTINGQSVTGTQVLPTSDGQNLPLVNSDLNSVTNPNPAGDNSPDFDGNEQAIVITPPQPIPRQFTFFAKGANGIASPDPIQLDLKTGVDPNNSNISYNTKIFQDDVDITSSVTINFINNTITFPQTLIGGGFPPSGTEIKFVVDTVVQGFDVQITGGVVTVETLRSLGWIINTE